MGELYVLIGGIFAAQLFLCLKAKNKHIRRIPLYLILFACAIDFFDYIGTFGRTRLDPFAFIIIIPLSFIADACAFKVSKLIKWIKQYF